MAVREILEIGHPVLAARAGEVDPETIRSPRVQEWIDDLIDTMRAAHGAGIAANQIGIPRRIFVVEVGAANPRYPYKPRIPLTVLVNPVITPLSSETFENNEGCLSVPNLRGVVTRHLEVEVAGLDREGKPQRFPVRGYSAGTYQHECDHLDGMLFPHRVHDPRTLTTWKVFKEFGEADFAAEVSALVERWGA